MEYRNYVDHAAALKFIDDGDLADALVKATLGLVVSRLPERAAVEMAAALPQPLDYERLRGHQAGADELSLDEMLGVLADQFAISTEQAREAAAGILGLAHEDLGPRRSEQVQRQLPGDWSQLFGAG